MNKKGFFKTIVMFIVMLIVILVVLTDFPLAKGNNDDIATTYGNPETDFIMSNGRLTTTSGNVYNNFIPNKDYVFKFDVTNQPETPFIFTFGGSGREHFEKHIQTADRGFIAVGRSNSSDGDLRSHGNRGDFDAIIVKYNSRGDVEWSDTFAGSGTDFFYHVVQTQDGNYIAVGTTTSTNGDAYGLGQGPVMVKYNQNGTILWKKSFRSRVKNGGRFLFILEDDNGYLYTASEEYQNYSNPSTGEAKWTTAVYRKLDRYGNEIWKYNVNGTTTIIGDSCAYGLTVMENGDVLGMGRDRNIVQYGSTKGNHEAYMVRIDGSTGRLEWRTYLNGANSDDFRQVVECDDGTLLAIGRTMSLDGDYSDSYNFSDSDCDIFVAKINKYNGNIIKKRIIGGYGYDNGRYLEKIDDGYLISGDTNRASGDFRRLTISGQDAIWFKIDDNFNINWIGKISGSGNEATQAGLKVGSDSYVVSGETSSRDGDFYGLYNGGDQDAFIAKLDKYGDIGMNPPDLYVDRIYYKIEAQYSNGTKQVIKSGNFYDEYIRANGTITKSVNFKTLDDINVSKIILTATIIDDEDINDDNNTITLEYRMADPLGQDFLINGYNIKDSNNKQTATLEINKSYTFNTNILNKVIFPNQKANLDSILDTLTYKVTVWDGVNQNSKQVISSGTKRNITINPQHNIWNSVSFKIPNNRRLNEVILETNISDTNDMDRSNNSLTVRLPIFYAIENDVGIFDDSNNNTDGVTIYPVSDNNTSVTTDDCYVVYGAPTNIKAVVGSTNVKTQNLKATLIIDDREVETKTVYGVSSDAPGAVYFNYTLNDKSKNRIKIQVRISPQDGTTEYNSYGEVYKNLSNPIYATVRLAPSSSTENTFAINNNLTGLSISDSVAYIKVKKRDRDKLVYTTDNCQLSDNRQSICPGHPNYVYDYDKPAYDAFIKVSNIKLENITQNYKITGIRFRSKYTKENKDKDAIRNILASNDGFINVLNDSGNITNSTQNQIKAKAGYGFELEVDTKYYNNLPQIFERTRLTNGRIAETAWSKYENYPGSNINVLYNNIDSELSKYNGKAIGIAVPAIEEIAIHNLNNLYIKTPSTQEEILELDSSIKNTNQSTAKYEISSDKKLYQIERKYKLVSKDNSNIEKYYIDKEVQNGDYEFKIFTPRAAIGALCDTRTPKLKDIKTFDIKVYGGYLDDVKTHLNE